MDMTGFDSPGSESEAELSIKREDTDEVLDQEVGGRWRGPEQMNMGGTHFYNL